MFSMVTLIQHLRAAVEWAASHRAGLVPAAVPMNARKIAFALAASAALAAPAAQADFYGRWERDDLWADGRLVDVQVQVEGEPAPLYLAPDRMDRRYVQAFEGRRYSLVVRNNSARRIGVLIAVDGLNVVNGERSSLRHDEAMYVLDPYERATIRGWRTSLDQVRRFVFVDEQRSYAERTGQANSDMGWIRVLAFRERNSHVKVRDWRLESQPAPLPGRHGVAPEVQSDEAPAPGAGDHDASEAPSAPRRSLERRAEPNESKSLGEGGSSFPGTGWGERRHDPVQRTQFTAERRAVDHIVVRYEYASGLRALGISLRRHRLWEREGELGFARPPRR